MAEGDHGDNPSGAQGREMTGEEGNESQDDNDGGQSRPIGDGDTIEEAAQKLGEKEGAGDPLSYTTAVQQSVADLNPDLPLF